MGRSRYKIHDNDYPYFLTCTIAGWLPLFSDPAVVEIVLDSFKFLQQNNRLNIYAYVIMENHLHLVASSEALGKEIGKFRSYTARTIIDKYMKEQKDRILKQLSLFKLPFKKDRKYQFWQEGCHPQQIESLKMMQQKVNYIHFNPVRRGYVDEPEDWRYSSARNYLEQEGLLDVDMDWL